MSPDVSSVRGKRWEGGRLCHQKSELQAATPTSSLPAHTDIAGWVMPTLAQCGAEDWDRSHGKETAVKEPGTERAECLESRFYRFHTLELSRKYFTEIKGQGEILKALGFACLYSLERAGEIEEDNTQC